MKNTMKANNKIPEILFIIMPAFLTLIVMLVLFVAKEYAPFGNNSLAWMDGSIQYLDIYSYFKDLVAGKNSLSYSFTKTLGGCMIAIFTYYLTSPFSILALFFSKENLHTFFDITLMLKFMLAATTCNIFLMKRFEEKLDKNHKKITIALLSFGYGLCQFNVAQCCNIMWIDGAYMLPLILLSVYRVLRKNEFWKLSLTVGFAIIFNWYTGAINCLFSAFWLLVELMFLAADQPKGTKVKAVINGIMKYSIAMLLGALLGGAVLAPTFWALSSSGRGGLDLWQFRDRFILSPFYSIAKNYYFGAEGSHYGGPALYVGGLAAIGCLSAFVTDNIEVKKKLILAFAFIGCGLLFVINPAFVVFSLLKYVSSGWFRYGYVGCLTIVFVAAAFFACIENEKYLKTLIIGSVLCTLILLFPHELNFESAEMKQLLLTILAILIIAILVMFLLYSIKTEKAMAHIIAVVLLVAICAVDMGYGFVIFMDRQHAGDVDYYANYVENEVKQIEAIKNSDNGTYRIAQNKARGQSVGGLTACYNDALAYNYWSISGYTSSPDDTERLFLDRVGYRMNGDNMCITNTSILPADALMGAKYIISAVPIKGLTQSNIATFDNKVVYENAFALPFGFVYTGDDRELDASNPFIFNNSIYSKLLAENLELYKPVSYEIIQGGDVGSGTTLKFKLNIENKDDAIYGNLPWYGEIDADIYADGNLVTPYSKWLSPSVFYIPCESDSVEIEVAAKNSYDLDYNNIQFYSLDLKKLREAVQRLSAKVPEKLTVENGKVSTFVKAEENEKLFLSIPADRGWKITQNGASIQPDKIADCFYTIDLVAGDNAIEMNYEPGNVTVGIAMFICGVIGTLIISVIAKRKGV